MISSNWDEATTMPEIKGRLLPPEEWAVKLAGTSLENAEATLDPAYCRVVVVEQGDQVVACWATMSIIHVEGLWQAPDAGAGVSRALLTAMIGVLKESGAVEVLTQSLSPAVDTLIEKAGGRKVPGQTWVIPVKEL